MATQICNPIAIAIGIAIISDVPGMEEVEASNERVKEERERERERESEEKFKKIVKKFFVSRRSIKSTRVL